MPIYQYRAASPGGEITEGTMEAPSEAAVVERLHRDGHTPIEVTVMGAAPATLRRTALDLLRRPLFGRARASRRDTLELTRGLAILLSAGLPLDRALATTASMQRSKTVRALISDLLARVRGGAALSEAMEGLAAFDRFSVAIVRAGEAGGTLDEALERLGKHFESVEEFVDNLKSALIYPTILLVVALLSVVILLTFVIPRFEALFDEAGASLPLATRVVIAAAEFVRGWGWLAVVAGLAGWFGVRLALVRPAARRTWDRWALALPWAGGLIARVEVERLCRSLGTLLTNGVPLPTALDIAAAALGNRALGAAVEDAAVRVREGGRLAESLGRSGLFPAPALALVRLGEESGQLDSLLLRTADIYGHEVRTTLKRLIAIIEPAMILFLGALIGAIILSVLVAITGLYDLAL